MGMCLSRLCFCGKRVSGLWAAAERVIAAGFAR